MSFHVRIVRRAERDAQQIFNWLAARSIDGAIRWWDAFEVAAAKSLIDQKHQRDQNFLAEGQAINDGDAWSVNQKWYG